MVSSLACFCDFSGALKIVSSTASTTAFQRKDLEMNILKCFWGAFRRFVYPPNNRADCNKITDAEAILCDHIVRPYCATILCDHIEKVAIKSER